MDPTLKIKEVMKNGKWSKIMTKNSIIWVLFVIFWNDRMWRIRKFIQVSMCQRVHHIEFKLLYLPQHGHMQCWSRSWPLTWQEPKNKEKKQMSWARRYYYRTSQWIDTNLIPKGNLVFLLILATPSDVIWIWLWAKTILYMTTRSYEREY